MLIENLNNKSENEIKKIRLEQTSLRLLFEQKPNKEKLQLFNDLILKHREDVTLVLKSTKNNWINLNDFQSINNIRDIEFSTFNKNPKFDNLDGIESFKKLKEVSFSYNYSNNIDLDKFSFCPELEYISLENSITRKHHKALNKIDNLKMLYIKGLDISLLEELQNLKSLHVQGLKNSNELDVKMPNLRKIAIHNSNKIINLDFLKGLNNIESITLNGINNVESLPNLHSLQNLKGFSVMNMKRLKCVNDFNFGMERLRIGKNVPLLISENLTMLTSDNLPNLKDITISLQTAKESDTVLKQLGR